MKAVSTIIFKSCLSLNVITNSLGLSVFVEPSPSHFPMSHFTQIKNYTGCHLNLLKGLQKSIMVSFIWSWSWDWILFSILTSLCSLKHFSKFSFSIWRWETVLFFKFASPRISGVTLYSYISACKQAILGGGGAGESPFRPSLSWKTSTKAATNLIPIKLSVLKSLYQNHMFVRYTFFVFKLSQVKVLSNICY